MKREVFRNIDWKILIPSVLLLITWGLVLYNQRESIRELIGNWFVTPPSSLVIVADLLTAASIAGTIVIAFLTARESPSQKVTKFAGISFGLLMITALLSLLMFWLRESILMKFLILLSVILGSAFSLLFYTGVRFLKETRELAKIERMP